MSAQSTIAKLREENLTMKALLKRATGEPLNAEEKTVIADIAKHRALEERLREEHTLEGAIAKAMRGTKTLTTPSPLAVQVAKAFNPPVNKSAEPEPTAEEQAEIDRIARNIKKVRGDVQDSGIPRRTQL